MKRLKGLQKPKWLKGLKKKRYNHVVLPYIIGFMSIFALFLIGFLTFTYTAVKPRLTESEAASQLAVDSAQLTEVGQIDCYNGSETYYTVYGQTESGETKLVAVNTETDTVMVYNPSDGISKEEALNVALANGATSASRIVFGVEGDTPIWEVYTSEGYYLVQFTTGELLKTIAL